MFTVGLGMIGLNFLLAADAYYSIINAPFTTTLQTAELELGLGEIFVAFGILLASTGWWLDQRAIKRIRGLAQPSERRGRRLAGLGIVVLGAVATAGATLYFGIVEAAPYFNATFTLPSWTLAFLYAVQGVGVLAIAAGWAIHRSALRAG